MMKIPLYFNKPRVLFSKQLVPCTRGCIESTPDSLAILPPSLPADEATAGRLWIDRPNQATASLTSRRRSHSNVFAL